MDINSIKETNQIQLKSLDDDIIFNCSYDNLQKDNGITTLPSIEKYNQSKEMSKNRDYTLPLVSICICMRNAEPYINETLFSVVCQSYKGPIELSIFDHNSTDKSVEIIKKWFQILKEFNIGLVFSSDSNNIDSTIYSYPTGELKLIISDFKDEDRLDRSKKGGYGVGYSRNKSIIQSHGQYIALLDSDDLMYCERIELQLFECQKSPNSIIGSNFIRIPDESTQRYTNWCNSLTDEQLLHHQYREITIIQPTWFFTRKIFNLIGGYEEAQQPGKDNGLYQMNSNKNIQEYNHKNQDKHIIKFNNPNNNNLNNNNNNNNAPIPEDLLFFHKHLELGGDLKKYSKSPLIIYRYLSNSMSNQIHRLVLMKIRLEYLEKRVLSKWSQFSIWSAGKDGKKFFTMLSDENKSKVLFFCDVDEKKIGNVYNAAYTPYKIPIIHFSKVKPPIIICVALDRSNGEFELNLRSLNLTESIDYYHFN